MIWWMWLEVAWLGHSCCILCWLCLLRVVRMQARAERSRICVYMGVCLTIPFVE